MDSAYHPAARLPQPPARGRDDNDDDDSDPRQLHDRRNGVLPPAGHSYDARSPVRADVASAYGAASNGAMPPHVSSTALNPAYAPTAHLPAPPRSPTHATSTVKPLTYPTYSASPREKPTGHFYDPTSDAGERRSSDAAAWQQHGPAASSPQHRDSYNAYPSHPADAVSRYHGAPSPMHSTVADARSPSAPHTHSHPPPMRSASIPRSPNLPAATSPGTPHGAVNAALSSDAEMANRANPMSFSSILSSAEPSAAKSSAKPTPKSASKPAASIGPNTRPNPDFLPATKQSRKVPRASNASVLDEHTPKPRKHTAATPTPSGGTGKRQSNGHTKPRHPSGEREREVQALMAKLDEEASDLESPAFDVERQKYKARSLKRKLEIEVIESSKQKLRRKIFADDMAGRMVKHVQNGEARYREHHVEEAVAVVQQKEIEAEKERKKDMQRKRRREKTVATNLEQKETLLAKAEAAEDETERAKLIREAHRAEKKAIQTRIILAQGDRGPDLRTVSPLEPNFHGGTMSTFAADADSGRAKGKGRGGARLRKSKEQKQAEKDSAEAAQAAIDAGEALPLSRDDTKIKLKLSARSTEDRDGRKSDEKENWEPDDLKDEIVTEPYVSKGYNQIYDQIWRDLGRKDVTKVYKLATDSFNVKSSNLKKTAILASKEAKRWQLRTNKGTKDLQARAKRTMREMMSFWKRNEREERDLRRAAEKQEIEAAKKAEADREANRQKRKLNFLISQTELYSHFIGKKIKTDEVERSTDHPDVAPVEGHAAATPTIHIPTDGAVGGKVTRFDQLDFDADDESALHAAAMANAQNAIQEAQNKARAFNQPHEESRVMDDEGEMNFQNPTGLGEVEIEQPKLLSCQLKEYQLKGLNWLVNLYEQGINGILADEMGLGKTVQSISVMAYLAETHNIWGPFLVVAPASTLHNWQQEIAKFVPQFKVLPYWGNAADRKVLRKFWDRKHILYGEDSPFHVMITSYQLVVSDVAYFQKMRWQYMILDEAQAIKSSQSSRWKSLLGFHCRNRLLLTGTPIQNNMQELWALLHFIMPSLFDSHDEFSEWFSKDIESHAQSNTKLNEDQLKRLHMILKPFMLRRVKKHVQKELGDKIELDIFCDLTYRQRAYYTNLRNQISLMDLIEKATTGDDSDTGTLMNLVMQFRKVCNHPDLFQRAEITSPLSFGYFAEASSFLREGSTINVAYSTRNLIEYSLPRLVWREGGRLDLPGRDNARAGFAGKYLDQLMNIWQTENVQEHSGDSNAFSWLRFVDTSAGELSKAARSDVFHRAVATAAKPRSLSQLDLVYDEEKYTPAKAMLQIVERNARKPLADITTEGYMNKLFNVSQDVFSATGLGNLEACARPSVSAPPIQVTCSSAAASIDTANTLFNLSMRQALFGPDETAELALVEQKTSLSRYPLPRMLPAPTSEKRRFNDISVPSMRHFVTDSGKLAKLDELLIKLKEEGHRVLLYFQMTRMIDLMEEYLTYRNYKYLRLDGSTKLEDRRDTVHDFQTRPEIFIFLLSTRAGGLGINLTTADTVIFYDSDWNPTIDSQAMDRAHRLGQTKQVTVYRMITRGTIEERIRKRALQKEEVQRVVIQGGAGGGVDFNTRSRENRTKDIAMWLADDDQAAEIERKEAEMAALDAKLEAQGLKKPRNKKRKSEAVNLDDMYHEGEGHFDDNSNKPSGAATPVSAAETGKGRGKGRRGTSKKAKTAKQRLAMADGNMETDF